MTRDDALVALFQKRPDSARGSIKPGLDRMRSAWEKCGFPGRSIPMIHVAGTNGKGSTCGFVYDMLSRSDLKAGLFTSPHLIHFRERFTLSSRDVCDDDLIEILSEIKSILGTFYEQCSFFEVSTLMALILFERTGVDVGILETGLGGRWDSTNVIQNKVSVITTIGMDHCDYLGDTIESIAMEKAGIISSDSPVVLGSIPVDSAEYKVITTRCQQQGIPCFLPGRDYGWRDGAWCFEDVEVPLENPAIHIHGYQLQNWSTAAAAVCASARKFNWSFDLGRALGPTVPARLSGLRGRFEWVTEETKLGVLPRLLVDVCHNPAGAEAFVESLCELGLHKENPVFLLSMMADKDIAGVVRCLRKVSSEIIGLPSPADRSMKKTDVPDDVMWAESVGVARQMVHDQFKDRLIIFCGSVIAAGYLLDKNS